MASSLTELFGPSAIKVRAGGDGAPLRLDRSRRARVLPHPPGEGAAATPDYALELTVERCLARTSQDAAVAALRFKTELLWAQLDAIERGDTQPAGSQA